MFAETDDGDSPDAAALEERVELLTAKVRADPNDTAAVDELATVLEQLERFHELLALLSARLDEAADEQRPGLLARRRTVLEKMIERAEREGRSDEAQLYALMLDQD